MTRGFPSHQEASHPLAAAAHMPPSEVHQKVPALTTSLQRWLLGTVLAIQASTTTREAMAPKHSCRLQGRDFSKATEVP